MPMTNEERDEALALCKRLRESLRDAAVPVTVPAPKEYRVDYMNEDEPDGDWYELITYDHWQMGDVTAFCVKTDDYDMDPFLIMRDNLGNWWNSSGDAVEVKE